MSSALGIVYCSNRKRKIGYFEYFATVDVARTAVRSREEVWRDLRTNANDRDCNCAEPVEQSVILNADYGNGFEWESTICARCMTIVGYRDRWAEAREAEAREAEAR